MSISENSGERGGSRRAGRYVRQTRGYSAFIPTALPPVDLELKGAVTASLSRADLALGRLDGAVETLPHPELFTAMYVRREAVLSSQIEGTQASLDDLVAAEARLRGDASTLVFDDPTTSLDHRHRRRIAKRLVELSASRPIAVLTHDVVFLTAMQQYIAKLTVRHSIQSVQWSSNAPGGVISGLGWESMAYRNQIHDLRARAATMVKQHGQYANEQEKREIEKGYTDLRGAIERATREIILNDTTHPFVAEVKVINLGGVVGFELAEWETLMNVYGKCSETTSGHDTPPDEQAEMPDAAEISKDLEAVDKVIEACKARRKTFEDGPKKKYTEMRNAARRS